MRCAVASPEICSQTLFSSLSGLPAPRSSRDLAEIWPRSSRGLAEMSRDPAEIQPRSGRDRAEIGPRSEACLRRAAGRMHRRRWPPQSCSRRYRAPTRRCLGSVQEVSSILLSTIPCSYRAAYTSLGAGRRDRAEEPEHRAKGGGRMRRVQWNAVRIQFKTGPLGRWRGAHGCEFSWLYLCQCQCAPVPRLVLSAGV